MVWEDVRKSCTYLDQVSIEIKIFLWGLALAIDLERNFQNWLRSLFK